MQRENIAICMLKHMRRQVPVVLISHRCRARCVWVGHVLALAHRPVTMARTEGHRAHHALQRRLRLSLTLVLSPAPSKSSSLVACHELPALNCVSGCSGCPWKHRHRRCRFTIDTPYPDGTIYGLQRQQTIP